MKIPQTQRNASAKRKEEPSLSELDWSEFLDRIMR